MHSNCGRYIEWFTLRSGYWRYLASFPTRVLCWEGKQRRMPKRNTSAVLRDMLCDVRLGYARKGRVSYWERERRKTMNDLKCPNTGQSGSDRLDFDDSQRSGLPQLTFCADRRQGSKHKGQRKMNTGRKKNVNKGNKLDLTCLDPPLPPSLVFFHFLQFSFVC